jgi:hypothetical protein
MNNFDKDMPYQTMYEFDDIGVISYSIPLSNVYIIVWYKILHDIKWQNEVTD